MATLASHVAKASVARDCSGRANVHLLAHLKVGSWRIPAGPVGFIPIAQKRTPSLAALGGDRTVKPCQLDGRRYAHRIATRVTERRIPGQFGDSLLNSSHRLGSAERTSVSYPQQFRRLV